MEKMIIKSIHVKSPVNKVWRAWTIKEELIRFFSPEVEIDLRPGGKYEMYFLLENEPGLRGGEGNRILSYVPEKMLSFEWNAPPSFPNVRQQKTWVVLFMDDGGENSTTVTLYHLGWESGKEWEEVFNYFTTAWDYVLTSLKKYLEDSGK